MIDHARVGQPGRDAAERERERHEPLRPHAGGPVLLDRAVDALLGAPLDGVGAHDLGAHHGLGDRGEHHADLVAHDGVRRAQLALEVAQADRKSGAKHTQTTIASCQE